MDANYATYAQAAAFIGAAIAMGLGSFGPAFGQGMIGKAACEAVGKNPEAGSKMRMMMLIAMGLVETSAIYAFVVAMLLILYNLPGASKPEVENNIHQEQTAHIVK